MPNFKDIWKIAATQFELGSHSLHGPSHWKRVEKNGLLIAEETGADKRVITLFAIFHDSRRVNEGTDHGHGSRGAALAKSLRGKHFDMEDEAFQLFLEACAGHTDGLVTPDKTIAACWDADRLDLVRVGITPDPRRMGTTPGKRLAKALSGR
jgi:uncharacterized protein